MSEIPLTEQDRLEIGGDNLLASVWEQLQLSEGDGTTSQLSKTRNDLLRIFIEDVRFRVGTLLKTENVSLLLGAGASVDCGGPLIGSIPLTVERVLHDRGISGTRRDRLRKWLRTFYLAVRYTAFNEDIPTTRRKILERHTELRRGQVQALQVNFEMVLATLHRWRSSLSDTSHRLRIDGALKINVTSKDLEECLHQVTRALACVCNLPTTDKREGLITYSNLVRKLLMRPLNLKRSSVFTLNYDTLFEQAADATGIVLQDGFAGTQNRVLRPESYEHDLYFPADTTEGKVHRLDRVLKLYKLHGSITWRAEVPTIENPYGVCLAPFTPQHNQPLLVYPTPAKYGELLGMPYSELFRRFSNTIARPQSVLLVIGYGFGDDHVNAVIRHCLSISSFTLVIVDPNPKSNFVETLCEMQDRRVWISKGPTLGTFAGFVRYALPDLQDEEVCRKVLATRQALGKIQPNT